MRFLKFRQSVESVDLDAIEWVRDNGETINFNKGLLDSWKFFGLSNFWFAEMILPRILAGEEKEILEEFRDLK